MKKIMINLKLSETEPHKANAIDKRAIHTLIPYLQMENERDGLNISFNELNDETSYRILKIDGYENIVFFNFEENYILETVQPIDRANNKLFPMQKVMLKGLCYKT